MKADEQGRMQGLHQSGERGMLVEGDRPAPASVYCPSNVLSLPLPTAPVFQTFAPTLPWLLPEAPHHYLFSGVQDSNRGCAKQSPRPNLLLHALEKEGIFLQLFVIGIFHALHQEGLAGALVNQGAVLGSFPASIPKSMAIFSGLFLWGGFGHEPCMP